MAGGRRLGTRLTLSRVAAGLRPADVGAAAAVGRFSAGESNFDAGMISNAACATTSQVLRLVFFEAQRTETVTTLTVWSGSTAAGATPSLVRLGIFSVAENDALTLLHSTANDTSLLAAANTGYAKALTTPWQKIAGQRYASGLLVVTGATAPTLQGQSLSASALLGPSAVRRRRSASVTGQTDLPSSVAAGSLVASASHFYVEMT